MRVWKYTIPIYESQPYVVHVPDPSTATVVAVRHRSDFLIDVWVEVDISLPKGYVYLFIVPTGQPTPFKTRHVGTAFNVDLGLVWHVYRRDEGVENETAITDR